MAPILGALAALVLSLMQMAGFMTFAHMGMKNIQNAAIASQMQVFDAAALQYVQDNGATIETTATATTPVTVTASQLSSAGYLPTGYTGANAFGQAFQAQVLQPTAGELETLVTTTGGAPISDTKQLAQIAAQVGATGGFVPYANQAGQTFSTTSAYGTYGAWTVPLTSFSNPGSGHLASLLQFTSVEANSSFLYRVAVPTHPALNNMQTDLGLTDVGGTAHNINGVDTVNAETGQFSTGIGAGGEPANSGYPTGVGPGLHTTDVYAEGGVYLSQGGATPNISLNNNGAMIGKTLQLANSVTPGTSCTTNGQMAANADGSGQMYSCLRGAWVPIGGNWVLENQYTVSRTTVGIPAPVCSAGGTGKLVVAAETVSIDPTALMQWAIGGPATGPWTVTAVDGSDSAVDGYGVASVYCAY
jgi:hypothetical protein